MHEMQGLVPDLLTNWFSLTRAKDALCVSAAVLAWNEVSPTTLESLLVKVREPYSLIQQLKQM